VLGANGAGKTTLLKTISGVVRARRGRITIDDRSTAKLRPFQVARLGVAHLPEARGIFADMTVDENLRLAAAYGRSRDDHRSDREAIDEALESFPDLTERRKRMAGGLSGGQQQMLAIARALIMRPRLLLADELSFGLAPVIVDVALAALRRFNERFGTSVLLVEQNVGKALGVASRAYVLRVGQIVLEAAAAELLADRQALFTHMGVETESTIAL
jgi:branched-chain amino acid transport system ATP-binding protein